jgi:hypothetical protein
MILKVSGSGVKHDVPSPNASERKAKVRKTCAKKRAGRKNNDAVVPAVEAASRRGRERVRGSQAPNERLTGFAVSE